MDRGEKIVVGYVAGRFTTKVIAPIAALVLAAVAVLAVLVGWTATQQDNIARRAETRLLATALDTRLRSEAEMMYDYAVWDEAYEKAHLTRDLPWVVDSLAGWTQQSLGIAMTFILDPEGRSWFGMVEGAPVAQDPQALLGEAAWRHVVAVHRTAPDRPRATFARVGGKLAVVAASPIAPHTSRVARRPGPSSTIVQVNPIDAEDLDELAQTYLLPELRLVEPPLPKEPSFAVRDGEGQAIATLTWRSARPGRDLLARVMPVLVLTALGLLLLTWVVLRHARDAAAALTLSESRASRDPLTGLPNRRLFDDRITTAFARLPRESGSLAVLYLDLDGFKPINDRLGHGAGDELLCEVARRLRAAARESDTVARLGGDEFAVLQVGGEQPTGAIRLAEAILAAITRPVRINEDEVRVGISIGIALAPQDAAMPRELIRCADLALYAAKSAGRGTWRLFGVTSHPIEPAAAEPAAEVMVQA